MTHTTITARFWTAHQYWWVWIDADCGLMYKAVIDDFGDLVRVSDVV